MQPGDNLRQLGTKLGQLGVNLGTDGANLEEPGPTWGQLEQSSLQLGAMWVKLTGN